MFLKKPFGKKRSFFCEELEPRILLSAGVEGLIFDTGWEPDAIPEADVDAAQIASLLDNSQTSTLSEPTLEIIFIDSSLPDYQSFITDLTENNNENRHFDIVVLDSERDGLSQITNYLQSQENIDAIHFITHGGDGQIQLGNTQLDAENVDNFSSDFRLWQSSLEENADILFYGCDIASSEDGQDLLQKISALTDADVAASDDTTGNSQLDGDWELEQNIGSIEATIALSSELQDDWSGILPIVSFQDGSGGYASTADTELDSSSPDSNNGTEESVSIVAGMNEGQGLIRFDNIFGAGAGQVPPGATITSATLTVNVTSASLAGANIELHEMLVTWDESSTWNSLTNGVQTDDTDASIAVDSTLATPDATGSQTFSGLESTLQSWLDGASTNFGWVITNDVNNNWSYTQSDDSTVASHPILTINYTTNVDPVITSGATPSVAENTTAVTTVTATDGDGDTPTFSITGVTTDDALFSITAGGILTFDAAPNFETPGDIGSDNVYDIEVTADDGNGGLTVQNIAITVSNVNEGTPVITSSAAPSVAENTTAVTTVTATDVDINDTVTYSITGVTADDALFSITAGGILTFDAAPNFEAPGDIGGDNVYDIEVTGDDGNGGLTVQNIAITVSNVNEAAPVITSNAAPSVAENTTAVTTVTATDVDINDTVTYSITGVTADDALFSITAGGVLTFDAAPNFDAPGDIGGDNVYDIEVTADDGNGGFTVQNITVIVTNSNELPIITSGAAPSTLENTTTVTTVTATDADAGDVPTFTISGGIDAGFFSIDNATGALTFNAAPNFEAPADSGANNVYDLQVTATDGSGGTTVQNISVTVTDANEAPTIIGQNFEVSADSPNGSIIGQAVSSDFDTADTLSYSITTGTGVGIFSIDSTTGEISVSNGNGLLSGTPQFYTLGILVTDSTGATAQAIFTINVLPVILPTETIIDAPTFTPPEPSRIDVIEVAEEDTNDYSFLASRPQVIATVTMPHDVEPNPDLPKVVMASATLPIAGEMDRSEIALQSIKTEYLQYRAGGALNAALDNMRENINTSSEESNGNKFKIAIQSSGIILTAGFASWIIRGSSLLASFLSTIPVWRGLDPLPILAAFKDDKEDSDQQAKDLQAETPESKVERYFEDENKKTPTMPVANETLQGRDSE